MGVNGRAEPEVAGSGRSPHFLKSAVPAATEPVDLVADRVVLVIVLVVVLGGIELGGRQDLGLDSAVQLAAVLQVCFGLFGLQSLVFIVDKDGAAVLAAAVRALARGTRRGA